MGALRVALYCEGVGEHGGEVLALPAPGYELADDHLGTAHLLVRRVLASVADVPDPAVVFLSPLRVRARVPRGSDLRDRQSLRQLLIFLTSSRRPHLGVVLVDADGAHAECKRMLEKHIDGLSLPTIVAVPTQEFESWLIADIKTVAEVLGIKIPSPPGPPETMKPAEAKALLAQWISVCQVPDANPEDLRRGIARHCDLDIVAGVCPSFQRLREDAARIVQVAF